MRKELKEIEIYKFDELNEEIQEELIEKEIEFEYNNYCELELYEDMKAKAKSLLQKYFKNKAEFKGICYSLGYCQGDGAMIEFYLKYYNEDLQIKQYGHYYHYNSFTIENCWKLSDERFNKLQNRICEMNQEFEKIGYNLIENCIDKESIVDLLKEYEYYKDGEKYI